MRWVIDLGGLALIVVNVALGLRYGLLRRGVALAGLYAGIGVASLIGNGVANFFNNTHDANALYRAAYWFVGIAFVIMFGIELLGFLYNEKIVRLGSFMFDRAAGAVLGAIVGYLQIAVVCLLVFAVGSARPPNARSPLPANRGSYSEDVQASVIGGRIYSHQDFYLNIFKPVLPSDLPAHLAENADTTKK